VKEMDVVVLDQIVDALDQPVYVRIHLKRHANVLKLMRINVNVRVEWTVEMILSFLILNLTAIKSLITILPALHLILINARME